MTAASAATPLSVTTTSPLPLAPLNTPYAATLAATGGTGSYTWSVATGSTLPSWLSLNSSTGVLSGTPTDNGTYTFSVTVTDSASPPDTATSSPLTLYVGNGGTQPFSFNMTSGSWTVLSSAAPNPFPAEPAVTLSGQVDPLTGAITGASLSSLPQQTLCISVPVSGCTNYIQTEVDPGTATGSINSDGDITLDDSLSYTLDVTTPIVGQCLSTPINMIFQSTAPYNPSTGDVTLVAANYNIPDFTGTDGNPDAPHLLRLRPGSAQHQQSVRHRGSGQHQQQHHAQPPGNGSSHPTTTRQGHHERAVGKPCQPTADDHIGHVDRHDQLERQHRHERHRRRELHR